ncbi:UNKNOWN [Stylonychia lemnae]|uniref:Uncharacterized protein n=1 Tax=Stylonychia lemnae TaxID=5949 RepID=A0A078AYX1_STYLE|nr:UNKNOWN [Stylonychia lemnae]|eukprot:CDW87331.1 UNKNOWN [Stylonychia lemnae]
MIVEREQIFSETDLKNADLFPNYIVVRKQINNQSIDTGEWQGFIKDLKYTIRTTAAKSKGEIIQNFCTQLGLRVDQIQSNQKLMNQSIQEQIQSLNQSEELKLDKNQKDIDSINSKIEGLDVQVRGLDAQNQGLDSKIMKLQNDMDFIKNSMIQLLQNNNQGL